MEWGVEIRDHFQHVQRIDDDKDQKSSLLPRFDEHTDLGNENDTKSCHFSRKKTSLYLDVPQCQVFKAVLISSLMRF